MSTTNYNIRLDQELKDKAFSVLEGYGLTPSQAIKLFLHQVAETNSIPLSFDYQTMPSTHTLEDGDQWNSEGGELIRIISARPATKAERRFYE